MHGHPKNTKHPTPIASGLAGALKERIPFIRLWATRAGGGFIVLGGGLAWVSILARSELAKYTSNEGIPFIIN